MTIAIFLAQSPGWLRRAYDTNPIVHRICHDAAHSSEPLTYEQLLLQLLEAMIKDRDHWRHQAVTAIAPEASDAL